MDYAHKVARPAFQGSVVQWAELRGTCCGWDCAPATAFRYMEALLIAVFVDRGMEGLGGVCWRQALRSAAFRAPVRGQAVGWSCGKHCQYPQLLYISRKVAEGASACSRWHLRFMRSGARALGSCLQAS